MWTVKKRTSAVLITLKMYNNQNQNNNLPVYPPPPVTEMAPSSSASVPGGTTGNFVECPIPDTALVDVPVFIVCPNCNYRGNTRVERVRGCAAFWCSFFCCISLCTDLCSDYQHVCPQCKVILRTYQTI